MDIQTSKKIFAEFYKTEAGNEPVRGTLQAMGRPTKTVVGEDILFVELNWRVDRPYVDMLRKAASSAHRAVQEVRHTVQSEEYRTLFFVHKNMMVLTHFFHKTTQKTPKKEIDLAWDRMKKWMKKQLEAEREVKKKQARRKK